MIGAGLTAQVLVSHCRPPTVRKNSQYELRHRGQRHLVIHTAGLCYGPDSSDIWPDSWRSCRGKLVALLDFAFHCYIFNRGRWIKILLRRTLMRPRVHFYKPQRHFHVGIFKGWRFFIWNIYTNTLLKIFKAAQIFKPCIYKYIWKNPSRL